MSSALMPQSAAHSGQVGESFGLQMVLRGTLSQTWEDASSFAKDDLRNLEQQLENDRIGFESDINSLSRSYVLVKPAEVERFVREHRALPALLHEVVPKLKECFGSDTVLQLQLGANGDEGCILRVLALWPGSLASANAALKAFDESFWIANCDRASGYLVIDRELV